MLMKTHLAIGIFAAFLLLDKVTYGVAFFIVTLVASLLPDIDSGFSTLGKQGIFKPIQFLTRHRGFIHSFTICVIISVILSLYLPILALPFFLGYGLHIFADSFTVDGIRPFWPLRYESKGILRVGSLVEEMLFTIFCILDGGLFLRFVIS